MLTSVWLVLLYAHLTSVAANKNVPFNTRIYSNQAEIIKPLEKLPLEFTAEDWNSIRSDSITLVGNDVNITLLTMTEQKEDFNGYDVYVRSPTSSDSDIKLIKGTLVDKSINLVKIQLESIADQNVLYITVPSHQIYHLQEPTKPKYYVNFTYTTSDSDVFVSFLQFNLHWRTQYHLDLDNHKSNLIAMANIRNDGKSPVFINSAELISGDMNLQTQKFQYDRLLRSYRSDNELQNMASVHGIYPKVTNTGPSIVIEAGEELAGLYVFAIENPFTIQAKTNYLLPMFRPRISIEYYELIKSTKFSKTPTVGKAQRSYRLRSDQYLPQGTCIIRENTRIVGEVLLPNLATNDTFEFSVGDDVNVVYKENITLISSHIFSKNESITKDSFDKSVLQSMFIPRTKNTYEIHLQLTNFKEKPVPVEYEQKMLYSAYPIKLITGPNDPFIQEHSSIKANLTLKAKSTQFFSFTVELVE